MTTSTLKLLTTLMTLDTVVRGVPLETDLFYGELVPARTAKLTG